MERLLVVLEGSVVGEIAVEPAGLRFEYAPAGASATPLSLSMPRTAREYPDERIGPWLAGLMPQDATVLQRWAARVGLAGPARPERLLGTPIGWDCPGAVQFCAPESLPAMLSRPRGLAPAGEDEIAGALRAAIADAGGARTPEGGPLVGPCYSLAGGQPKIALAAGGGGWRWPTGAAPSTHILKPPPGGTGEQPVNEHLCLATARRLGLEAAASSLATVEDLTVAVVERYDRAPGPAGPVRLHQEDACQALGRPPDTRAEALGGVSTVHVASVLRSAGAPAGDVWTIVDRLALAWALGLVDGHGKNTSLLLSGEEVRLAPLYDIASMLPYASDGADIYLSMHVGDEPALALIGRAHWEAHAARLGLPAGEVLERAGRIAEEAAGAVARAAADCADHPAAGTFPERFATAAAAWREHCLASLTHTPTPRPPRPGSGLGLTCLA